MVFSLVLCIIVERHNGSHRECLVQSSRSMSQEERGDADR